MQHQSDEALIAAVAAGDREAFGALYRLRRPDVYRFALHMAGLAAAAALLVATLVPIRAGRGGYPSEDSALHKPLLLHSRPVQLEMAPPAEFVLVPGAAALPPMESGSLVRMKITKNLNCFVIFANLVAFVPEREPSAVSGATSTYGS